MGSERGELTPLITSPEERGLLALGRNGRLMEEKDYRHRSVRCRLKGVVIVGCSRCLCFGQLNFVPSRRESDLRNGVSVMNELENLRELARTQPPTDKRTFCSRLGIAGPISGEFI